MKRSVLVIASAVATFVPGTSYATSTDTLYTSANNIVNLVAGNLYDVTFSYSSGSLSSWALQYERVLGPNSYSPPSPILAGGPSASTISVNQEFTSPVNGVVNLVFTKSALFGTAPSVSFSNTGTISGTFGSATGTPVPGPTAGVGLAGLLMAALSFFGLRAKRAV